MIIRIETRRVKIGMVRIVISIIWIITTMLTRNTGIVRIVMKLVSSKDCCEHSQYGAQAGQDGCQNIFSIQTSFI